MRLQSLIFKEGINFDLIEIELPDGENISYYFDISRFF